MKKNLFAPSLIMFMLLTALLSPNYASAHGHTSFEINEKVYSFTIGSLNEPVSVDDKTGLDMRVMSMSHHAHEMANKSGGEHAGTPVLGLDKTLKVELIAGDKKKILDISPAYNEPGAYRAYFIPTVQTTFSYRVFGTIDNVPFDYTFTCNPAGHPQTDEDTREVEISKGVTRIEAGASFGCPVARADLGFPEPSMTTYELDTKASDAKSTANTARIFGIVGIVFGVLGLTSGALMKKKA
ncbi:hypothetical protein K8Q98_02680 [Candidatus Nomurabacteria bacterium]|nr:hypothetical protein [Candidatus Nomurabacteria bacterium]